MANNGDVKVTFKEKRKRKYFFIKHHGDLIFLFIVLVLFSLGFAFTYCESWNEWLISFYTLDVYNSDLLQGKNIIEFVTIIIPTLITIITIGISIPDVEIYGLHYSDFRRIRGDYEYSLLWMILISILILLLSILSNILQFFWTTITLNVISLTYCIIFMCKEIPILTKKDNVLFKIVRKSNEMIIKDSESANNTSEGKSYFSRRQTYLVDLKTYLLFFYGINKTFRILYCTPREDNQNKYEEDLLRDLISLQNEYLNGLYQNYLILKDLGDGTYRNIYITTAISSSVDNAFMILNDSDEISLLGIIKKSPDLVLLVSEMMSTLYKVLVKLGTYDCYKKKFESTISCITPFSKSSKNNFVDKHISQTNDFNAMISSSFAMTSVEDEQFWYFNTLKNIGNSSVRNTPFGDDIDNVYLVFLSLYLFYYSKRVTNNPAKSDVDAFCSEIKWQKRITKILKSYIDGTLEEKIFLLDKIFSTYWCVIKSHIQFNSGYSDRNALVLPNRSFDSNYIYHWWVKFLNKDDLNNPDCAEKINSVLSKYKVDSQFRTSDKPMTFEHYWRVINEYFTFYNVRTEDVSNEIYSVLNVKDLHINTRQSIDNRGQELRNFIEKEIKKMNEYFPISNGKIRGTSICSLYLEDIDDIKDYFRFTPNINVYTQLFGDWLSPYMPGHKLLSTVTPLDANELNNICEKTRFKHPCLILPKDIFLNPEDKKAWKEKLSSYGIELFDLCFPLDLGLLFEKNTLNFRSEITLFKIYPISDKDVERYISEHCRLDNGLYRYSNKSKSKIFYSKSALVREIKEKIVSANIDVSLYSDPLGPTEIYYVNFANKG